MPNSFLTSEGSVPDLRKYQTTDEKIEVLQNYLYQLLEELRYTLHNISADNIDTESWNRRLEEATETSSKISLISQTIDEIRATLSQNTDTIEGLTSRYTDIRATVDGLIVAVGEGVDFDGSGFVQRSEFEVTASQVSSLVTQVETNTTGISNLQSSISQTASQIRSEVSQTYETKADAATMEQNLSSSITQTASDITSQVAQTYETKVDAGDKLVTAKSYADSQISQSASAISAAVSSTYETKTDAEDKLETAKNYTNAQLEITSENITTNVSQTYETKSDATSKKSALESQITQTASDITSSVSRTYETKTDATSKKTAVESLITQRENAIMASVSSTYETIANVDSKIAAAQMGMTEDEIYAMVSSRMNIGATNMLIDSKKDASGAHTTYNICDFNLSESLEAGKEYTVSAKINLSSERKTVAFFFSGGSISLSPWIAKTSDGYYTATFTATSSMASNVSGAGHGYIRVYASNNNGTQGSTAITGSGNVAWIKLEKGNIATDWDPAPIDYTSKITANATAIQSKVSAGDVVSVINQSAEKINASAVAIDLSGFVTFTDLTDTSKTIINGGVIQTGTILANQIASNAITTDKLNANAVTAAKIAANAITTDKLNANAVTAAKIAASTITGDKIAANTIATGNLAANAVTTAKLAANAVTADIISANAVTAAKISSGAVTTDKLAANAVTAAKIAASTITATQIAANTITGAKIAAGTITASNIKTGTITADQIAARTITAAEIATGTITATQISSNYVYAGKIAASQITSGTIATGRIKLGGNMTVYESASSSTAGGYVGYASGNDGESSTNGIQLKRDSSHYLFISNAGAVLRGNTRVTLQATVTKCTGNLTCSQLTTSGQTYIYGGGTFKASEIEIKPAGTLKLGGSGTTNIYAYSSNGLKSTAAVYRNGSGYLTNTSSNAYKKNLERALTSEDVEPWYTLPIYHGSFKEEYCKPGDLYYGEHLPLFTVDDIEKICPEANFHNLDGTLDDCMWDSNVIIPIMLKMIQDQKTRIDVLEGKVS